MITRERKRKSNEGACNEQRKTGMVSDGLDTHMHTYIHTNMHAYFVHTYINACMHTRGGGEQSPKVFVLFFSSDKCCAPFHGPSAASKTTLLLLYIQMRKPGRGGGVGGYAQRGRSPRFRESQQHAERSRLSEVWQMWQAETHAPFRACRPVVRAGNHTRHGGGKNNTRQTTRENGPVLSMASTTIAWNERQTCFFLSSCAPFVSFVRCAYTTKRRLVLTCVATSSHGDDCCLSKHDDLCGSTIDLCCL